MRIITDIDGRYFGQLVILIPSFNISSGGCFDNSKLYVCHSSCIEYSVLPWRIVLSKCAYGGRLIPEYPKMMF